MSDALPIAPDELFQHAEFLKHLARRLLKDEHLAEDVAQEALVAAWRDPPRERGALRTWLARTAHNLALNRHKAEAGRARREESSARPERQDPQEDALERLELQRVVFEQVLALDEAKRTALFLRYHEGLEPAAIAARLELPLKTVKTRLARGLEELRERLERRYDGDRRALALALVELARGPAVGSVATAIGGGLAMKWILGVAAAVIAWLGWQGTRPEPVGEGRALARSQGLVVLPDGSTEARTAPAGPQREARTSTERASAPTYVLTGTVRKREDGSAVRGSTVQASVQRLRLEHLTSVTNEEGRFRFELGEPTTLVGLHAGPTATTAASVVWLNRRLADGTPLDVAMWVTDGARLLARVVDTLGNPIGGATVQAWCQREFDPSSPAERSAISAGDGSFELAHLGESFVLSAEKQGLVCLQGLRGVLVSGAVAQGLEVVMGDAAFLRGRVLDEQGRAVEGAELVDQPHLSRSQEDTTPVPGVERFQARDLRARSGPDGSFVFGPVPREQGSVRVTHPGFLPASPLLEPEQHNEIVLVAGQRLAGIVRGAEGQPLPDAAVHVHPQDGEERRTTTDEAGRFEVAGVSASESAFVLVSAEEHAVLVRQPFAIGPDAPSFTELRLERSAPLAGRVVNVTGTPIADALVRAEGERFVEVENTDFGELTTWEWRAGCNEVRTDAEGRFRFTRLYAGPFRLLVSPPDAPDLRAEVSVDSGREDVEVVLDRQALERVVFTGTVRDGSTGEPLDTFTFTPMGRSPNGSLRGNLRSFGPEAGGSFRLAGHAAGEYELRVSAPGHAAWIDGLRAYREGEHRFEVVLWPACTIRLSVVDGRGGPLAARLVFHDLDDRLLSVEHGTWNSNSIRVDGEEQVLSLPRSLVRVTASVEGRPETSFDLDLRVPPLGPVVLTLPFDAGIQVRCMLALLVTEDPKLAATSDVEALHAAFLEGQVAPLETPARIEFLDRAGETVAEARLERDEQDRQVAIVSIGSTSTRTLVGGPELSLRLPAQVVTARIRAEGCLERELALELGDQDEVRLVVALLAED